LQLWVEGYKQAEISCSLLIEEEVIRLGKKAINSESDFLGKIKNFKIN